MVHFSEYLEKKFKWATVYPIFGQTIALCSCFDIINGAFFYHNEIHKSVIQGRYITVMFNFTVKSLITGMWLKEKSVLISMLTSSDAKWRCLWHMLVWSINLSLVAQFLHITSHVAFYIIAAISILVLPALTAVYSNTSGRHGAGLLR